VVQATISLKEAQFWMNIHRNLLAVDETALEKMRALVIARAGSPDDYEPDIQLVTTEIDRVLGRLRYWDEMVDRSHRANARLITGRT
jgi:hypothetical protein